jgi:UDP-N-acetylmuramoyl-tripeptide--D-alanyl-D-alanine ligase
MTAALTLTIGFVRRALAGHAKVIAKDVRDDLVLARVNTDSRKAASGDLFVAIKGDAFDGHSFIANAVSKGSTAVICERYPAEATQEGVHIFLVEDTLKAYRLLAQHWREAIDPQVVGVAGSVGKTTTKDLLAPILGGHYKAVLKTQGSQNGFVGLPLTLLEITPNTDVAVIEIGIDAPHAMKQHIDVVRPDVAIVTAISEEHLEWLKDLETIAYEENLILRETAQSGGIAVINLDDPWTTPLFDELKGKRRFGFSLLKSSSIDVLSGRYNPEDSTLTIEGLGFKSFELTCPLLGEHNARNLLGAVAVSLLMGVKAYEIKRGLEAFVPSGGRSQLSLAASGTKVLRDYYNASPASMRAAFEVAKREKKSTGRVYLCLGDMKELGEMEEELHRSLAKPAIEVSKTLTIFLLGQRMSWLEDELKKLGFSGSLRVFATCSDLASALKAQIKPDDFVVIKGSHSMNMSQVWDGLIGGQPHTIN